MKMCDIEENFNPSTSNNTISVHKFTLSAATLPNPKRDESIQTAYQETKASLDLLKTQKRQFRAEYSKFHQDSEEKLKKTRSAIAQIDQKLEKLEQSSHKLNQSVATEKSTRIEEFKSALLPLQTSADIIENTKTQLSTKLEELTQNLESLNTIKDNKQTLLDQKFLELNRTNSEIQTIRNKIEEISKDRVWDHMEVFQESKAKIKVEKIREAKCNVRKDLLCIEDEINKLKNSVEGAVRSEGNTESEGFEQKIEEINHEIQQLEEFLNLQSRKYSCKEIWQVLVGLSNGEDHSILDYVAKEQVFLIKNKKMHLIDSNKNLEWLFEEKLFTLNAEIKEIELNYYESVKLDKESTALEKALQSKKKEFSEKSQEYEFLKKKNSVQLQTLDKWLEKNRNLLTVSESYKFPDDDLIVEEYLKEFCSKHVEKAEREATKNVIYRYIEKVKQRSGYYMKISAAEENKHISLEDKAAYDLKIKAEIKSKDIEREKLQIQFENFQNEEKVLLKDLEKYKLEIESGRKIEMLDLIKNSKATGNNIEEIKKKFLETAVQTVQKLRILCDEKQKAKVHGRDLFKQIKEVLKPELETLNKEISTKTNEVRKLEEDLIVLENSKEELLIKLGLLADHKREEMYKAVRTLGKKHGSAKFDSIEKLYTLRSEKEAELIELELESIKQQKLLSEKELKNSMEIIKLSARAEAMEKSVKKNKRTLIDRQNRLSCFDIGSSFLRDKSEGLKSKHSASKSKSFVKISDTLNNTEILRSTLKTESSVPIIDIHSEISLEIPLPAEPKYICSEYSTEQEKRVFESILPILEGCVLFKKQQKSNEVFDPLEFSVKPPEDCGYVLRKMKINKQLTKIEVRQVGKSGIDSCIMVDSILSVSSCPITNTIIKAQSVDTSRWDNSLENLAKCSKEYREMKFSGKINHSAPYFVIKSKETHFYPFYMMLKTGKLEFVADSFKVYSIWTSGLQCLIKNKALLEKLKFKIQAIE